MARKLFLVVLVIISLLAISCSKQSAEAGNPIIGDVIKDIEAPVEQDTVQETPVQPVDCSNKADLQQKLDSINQKIAGYENELKQLNTELLVALRAGNYDGMKSIQYDVEKALKLDSIAKRNSVYLTEQLSQCS